MSFRNFFFLLIAFLMHMSLLKAQEIIGRTTILGKEVEIFDNQTWRYATPDKEFSDCEKLQLDIYFCNVSDWKKVKASGEVDAMFELNSRTFLMFIIEEMGSDDGVSTQFMKEIALLNAAQGDEDKVDEIYEHFSKNRKTNGHDFLSVAYSTNISGIKFTMLNNIFVGQRKTMQAAIYTVGDKVTNSQLVSNEILLENLFLN